MAVQCKNGDVTFDTSATIAINADFIPVGIAIPGELFEIITATKLQTHNNGTFGLSTLKKTLARLRRD